MKPYITELAERIAHELDVNTSQVRKWSSTCRKYWGLVTALRLLY
jgi:transposase-like protein